MFGGPWLKPSLDFLGYTYAEDLTTVQAAIDRFYAMLQGLASKPANRFTVVGVLPDVRPLERWAHRRRLRLDQSRLRVFRPDIRDPFVEPYMAPALGAGIQPAEASRAEPAYATGHAEEPDLIGVNWATEQMFLPIMNAVGELFGIG